jgi:hypothetical protein
MRDSAFIIIVALASGCSSSLVCKTQTCDHSSRTYQGCAGIASATYNFGGMSCSCTASASGCQACAMQLASFCGDTNGGASGGPGGIPDAGGGGGVPNGGGSSACTLTLAGAVSGSFACNVAIAYDSRETSFIINANPSQLMSVSIAIIKPGMLNGAFMLSSSDSDEQGVLTAVENGNPTPIWVATHNSNDPDAGSYNVSATVASAMQVGSGWLASATGHATATLAPLMSSGANGTITLNANF